MYAVELEQLSEIAPINYQSKVVKPIIRELDDHEKKYTIPIVVWLAIMIIWSQGELSSVL